MDSRAREAYGQEKMAELCPDPDFCFCVGRLFWMRRLPPAGRSLSGLRHDPGLAPGAAAGFAGAFRWHPLFWTLPLLVLLFLFCNRLPKKAVVAAAAILAVLFAGTYIVRMVWLFPRHPTDDGE